VGGKRYKYNKKKKISENFRGSKIAAGGLRPLDLLSAGLHPTSFNLQLVDPYYYHASQYYNNIFKERKNRENITSEEEKNRQAKENRAILQLSLVVGYFAIGYLPTTGKKTERSKDKLI